jgi:signal transduction histidine kinase
MNPVAMGNPTAAATCESRQLVSDLLHQLSQPLTTLCCALELALLQTPTLEQYGEIVSQALGQAEKASSLATAIRELFDAGQPGGSGDLLELRRAVEEAIADLLPVAESAGVQVRFVPGPACPVWFDAPRLRQGLFHLIGFAIGWGGAGAAVRIELAQREAGAMLTLTVSGGGDENDLSGDSDLEFSRRLGLGIARAIFEAGGGGFHVARSAECPSVEVGILRKRR